MTEMNTQHDSKKELTNLFNSLMQQAFREEIDAQISTVNLNTKRE